MYIAIYIYICMYAYVYASIMYMFSLLHGDLPISPVFADRRAPVASGQAGRLAAAVLLAAGGTAARTSFPGARGVSGCHMLWSHMVWCGVVWYGMVG